MDVMEKVLYPYVRRTNVNRILYKLTKDIVKLGYVRGKLKEVNDSDILPGYKYVNFIRPKDWDISLNDHENEMDFDAQQVVIVVKCYCNKVYIQVRPKLLGELKLREFVNTLNNRKCI